MLGAVNQLEGELPTGADPRLVRLPNVAVLAARGVVAQAAVASAYGLLRVAARAISYIESVRATCAVSVCLDPLVPAPPGPRFSS